MLPYEGRRAGRFYRWVIINFNSEIFVQTAVITVKSVIPRSIGHGGTSEGSVTGTAGSWVWGRSHKPDQSDGHKKYEEYLRVNMYCFSYLLKYPAAGQYGILISNNLQQSSQPGEATV